MQVRLTAKYLTAGMIRPERSGKGSHAVFSKDGTTITVPTSKREVPIGTYRSIAKAAGWL